MPNTPQFGGTNSVPELDIGQEGSARRAAGTAQATIHCPEGNEEMRRASNALPQSNYVFWDNLGSSGRMVAWKFHLYTTTSALIQTIKHEIDYYRSGFLYTPGSGFSAYDATRVKPTRLTNGHGNVLSDEAVIHDISWRDSVRKMFDGRFHVEGELVFKTLR